MNDLSAPAPGAPAIGPACADAAAPFALHRPPRQTVPLVCVSAHSGTDYTPGFRALTRLSSLELRRSEDCFVDRLFAAAPAHGAPLLTATFPRAFCDANRDAWELDAAMFDDALPAWVDTRSARAIAGFGTVPRLVGAGAAIYPGKIRFADALLRVDLCWRPFHAALSALVRDTIAAFGRCLLVDCHSMPRPLDGGRRVGAAYVLGDAHGSSAGAPVIAGVDRALKATGRLVARNDPYAGGYITRHYGRPAHAVHAVQIELARDLYLDDATLTPAAGYDQAKLEVDALVARLAAFAATMP